MAVISRRCVLQGVLAAAVCGCSDNSAETFTAGPSAYSSLPKGAAKRNDNAFRLKFAPHFGMFANLAGPDYVDQLKFAASQGFRAWEDNIVHRRAASEQERIAETMRDHQIEMGVFIAADLTLEPSLHLTAGDPEALDYFLEAIKRALPVARRFNSKWTTILLGDRHPSLPYAYQMANLVEALRRAAEIVEPEKLVMVVEPVNSLIQRPTIFLDSVRDIYLLCKAVDSPSCKILFDIYHHQVMHGNIIPDLDHIWDEIAYVQVADHPGRNEPTTGEINYVNVFQHLHKRGYKGIVGMEHGVSRPGADGERAVIEAYRYCDSFLE